MNKHILILIPDRLEKPMGGMGEQARNILAGINGNLRFTVIGSANEKKYYKGNVHYMPVMDVALMHGDPDPLAKTFLNQSLFVERAMSLSKPDIVHAFDWSTFWAGRILSKHWNIPLVVTIQLSIEKMTERIHPLQQMNHDVACSMELAGLVDANIIIQVSRSYLDSFNPIFRDKSVVIENGISLNEWKQTEQITLPGKAKNKLIYIGRYAEMKNISSLLKAEVPENVDLIFIGGTRGGSSELFDAMIQATKERENLHYVGEKYGQDKINWLMSADGVIVPSVHEPFGIVGLEALASKSILLSSFVGGMGDYLNPTCAINCGITPESISKAIKQFAGLDNSTKQYFIESGLEVCREYDWSIQSAKLKDVYNKLLNKDENINCRYTGELSCS